MEGLSNTPTESVFGSYNYAGLQFAFFDFVSPHTLNFLPEGKLLHDGEIGVAS